MGRGDNRKSLKTRRRRGWRAKKERLKKKMGAGTATKTSTRKRK